MDRSESEQSATLLSIPRSRWKEEEAAGLSEPQLLRYRSNILGADLAVTNFGGGNTSAKIEMQDPLTDRDTRVLWVKGSGGDLGSIDLDGFASLYLEKLLMLETRYRGREHEDEMVAFLPFCTFANNLRTASIDTPLHAFLPFAHVDHMHPDAVIAVAASKDSQSLTRDIYQGKVGWLSWQRPGFDLGLRLKTAVAANSNLRGIVLQGHGLISWGDTSRACYENTIDLIAIAARYLNGELASRASFGGQIRSGNSAQRRREIAASLLPRLRVHAGHKIGHFDDSTEVLEFANSDRATALAEIGTSCPDHFLRTKIQPLIIEDCEDSPSGEKQLEQAFASYREKYTAYYERNRTPESPPLRDPNPVVILVPGVGMMTFAKNKSTARVAGEFYRNAINVMRGAEAVSRYCGLPESEAFGIEYWALEDAKLQRLPKPKALEGRIALITGGAGGIGKATANRLLQEGASVVLADRDEQRLHKCEDELGREFGRERIRATLSDVTREDDVAAAVETAALEFGGLDILVANAGIASSAPIETTSLSLWQENYSVLAQGYFLAARAAFPLMKGLGGSIVFVGSKNALAPSINASAYASAKAAALHLARCLALEGAPFGIRVNTVNPDAVLRGSHIWSGTWRDERARAYDVEPGEELEAYYRARSLLKREVLPGDVAEAIYFFAGDQSGKSTGNILNVDGGNANAFTR